MPPGGSIPARSPAPAAHSSPKTASPGPPPRGQGSARTRRRRCLRSGAGKSGVRRPARVPSVAFLFLFFLRGGRRAALGRRRGVSLGQLAEQVVVEHCARDRGGGARAEA